MDAWCCVYLLDFGRMLAMMLAIARIRMPEPSKKPKLYQFPLLCTSYTLTLSEKKETTKVTTTIMPCQSPSQNPAMLPSTADVSTTVFGPAAHPLSNRIPNSKIIV